MLLRELEKDLERFHRQIEEIFSDFEYPSAERFPRVNMWSNHEAVIVTSELPGVEPKELDITLKGKTLTLKGTRKADGLREGEHYHLRERWTGDFLRNIELPFEVDPDKVKARYSKGVLYIHLPRAEEDKPKKITVES